MPLHGAENPQQYPPIPPDPSFDAVLELAVARPDQQLSYGAEPLQYGMLWLPDTEQAAPLVIFIHGGCWLNSFDVGHSYALATALRNAGFAVWSLEYRRTGDAGGGWPGTLADVRSGIDYSGQLESYGVDVANTVLMGHSAGGHLALLAGAEFATLRGVVGLAAITDIVRYAQGDNSCQTATPQFMGATPEQEPQRYRAANPVQAEIHPETYLLHGGADAIVPPLQQTLLTGAHTVVEPNAGHFDWIHPGSAAFEQLITVLQSLLPQ